MKAPDPAIHPPTSRPRSAFALFLRGVCMGSADVVPGVSGGTMAFIMGIYDDLLANIRAFTLPSFWRPLLSGRVAEAFASVDWKFLLLLGSGILTAILTLARSIQWMLDNQPVLIWSFFFGLVLASIVVVRTRVRRWSAVNILLAVVGTAGAYLLVGLVPTTTPDASWFVFLSGAIAICAMILPGISGSFILVLLGKYDPILRALTSHDVVTILIFSSGCGVGILGFSHVLTWLLKHYHDATIAVLTGFMLGSLRKVWPWKETVLTMVDRHGNIKPLLENNLLPPLHVQGAFNGEIAAALGAAFVGLVLVLVIESVAMKKERQRAVTGPSAGDPGSC